MNDLVGLRCLLMRGGTSRGPFINAADLPTDIAARDRVLLALMGSPDARQIDGLGGADTLTSKVAIISKSQRLGIDLDYLFAQVDINRPRVDTAPSCGNMLAAVAAYGVETGLIAVRDAETRVMIYNINTGARIESVIQTPGGRVLYEGTARIDGVPGTAAPVILNFMDVVGSLTGALLPTGQALDTIDGIDVSCVDVAMPMMLLRASDFGLHGHESKTEIDGNTALLTRIEALRREAGRRMGLGEVADKVVPKVGLLAQARNGGSLASLYLTPHALHSAHAITGAVCVASACAIPGTIAHEYALLDTANPRTIWIEHPSGKVDVVLETIGTGPTMDIKAGTLRTARLIMRGEVMVPRAAFG